MIWNYISRLLGQFIALRGRVSNLNYTKINYNSGYLPAQDQILTHSFVLPPSFPFHYETLCHSQKLVIK